MTTERHDQPAATSYASEVRRALAGSATPDEGDMALDGLLSLARGMENAIREIVAAAEALTRPGIESGSVEEMARGVRMTNAIQAAARLVGDDAGIMPEATL